MLSGRLSWLLVLSIAARVSLVKTGPTSGIVDLTALDNPYLTDYYRICPLPICDRCKTFNEIQTLGVGFALETGHG